MANGVMNKRGRPLLFETVEALDEAINAYFEDCKPHYEMQESWEDMPRGRGGKVHFEDDGVTIKQRLVRRRVFVEGKKPNITSLAVALNTSRQTLLNYAEREDFFDSIKRAKDICEAYANTQLYEGKNVAGVIFDLTNNYSPAAEAGEGSGWINRTDVTTGGDKLGAGLSPEAAAVLDKANRNTR